MCRQMGLFSLCPYSRDGDGPSPTASGSGSVEPRLRTLPDDRAFKLCEQGKDVKY